MKKKLLWIFCIFFTLLTLAVVLFLWEGKPQAKIKGFQMKKKEGKAYITAYLEVKNLFALGYLIDYQILYGEEILAQGKLDLPASEIKEGVAHLPMPIIFHTQKMENLRKKAKKKREREIELQIQGRFQMRFLQISFGFPFSLSQKISLEKALEVRSTTLEIKKVTPKYMLLQFEARVHSNLSQKVHKLLVNYENIIDQTVVMKGQLTSPSIFPKQTNTIRLPLQIARREWEQIRRKYDGQTIEMTLRGNFQAITATERLSFPFFLKKETFIREKPIQVSLKKIRVKKRRLKAKTYYVVLELKSLLPRKIDHLVIDGEIEIAKGIKVQILNDQIRLAPKEKILVEAEVTVKRFALLQLLAQKIRAKFRGKKASFRFQAQTEDGVVFSGRTQKESFAVPVEEE